MYQFKAPAAPIMALRTAVTTWTVPPLAKLWRSGRGLLAASLPTSRTAVMEPTAPPIAKLCRSGKRLPAALQIAARIRAAISPTYSACQFVGLYAT